MAGEMMMMINPQSASIHGHSTTEELLTNGSLNFAHDLIIWDRLPTFIFGDDLRFLVDFLSNRNTEHDVSEAAAMHAFVCVIPARQQTAWIGSFLPCVH